MAGRRPFALTGPGRPMQHTYLYVALNGKLFHSYAATHWTRNWTAHHPLGTVENWDGYVVPIPEQRRHIGAERPSGSRDDLAARMPRLGANSARIQDHASMDH